MAAVHQGLTEWLRSRRPESTNLRVAPLTRPSDGLSSETFFVDATWDGGEESLVARLAPVNGLFAQYNLGVQARLQATLPALGVPAAVPIAYEEDASWLGTPFLVMPRVEGQLLADNPPYYRRGWLHDAPPPTQRRLFCGFLDTLADVHRLDWRAEELDFAARPGGVGLRAELDWWTEYLDWAAQADAPPDLVAALAWCAANIPPVEPPSSLLWGDVRLGNVIFDTDGTTLAVLDWEMASIGPAEIDLGWFFALRDLVIPPGGRELPGFLDRQESLARYEARLGRDVGDLWWYEVFALVRSTAVLVRMQRLLIEQGQSDHWLVGFDPVPAKIKSL